MFFGFVMEYLHTQTHSRTSTEYLVKISQKGLQVCFLCVRVCTSLKQHNRCWSTCLSCTLTTWRQWEDSGCEAELVNTGHWVSWVTHMSLASGSSRKWKKTFSEFHDGLAVWGYCCLCLCYFQHTLCSRLSKSGIKFLMMLCVCLLTISYSFRFCSEPSAFMHCYKCLSKCVRSLTKAWFFSLSLFFSAIPLSVINYWFCLLPVNLSPPCNAHTNSCFVADNKH